MVSCHNERGCAPSRAARLAAVLLCPSVCLSADYLVSDPVDLFSDARVVSEEGDTKDDLQLPTYPDGFGNEIKAKFDDGLTLVRLDT